MSEQQQTRFQGGQPPQDQEYDQRDYRQAPAREKPDYAKLAEQFTEYTADDLEIIWERNDELLTVGDFRFFLYYCKQHKVDPVVGECVASYRWNSIKGKKVLTPIVTIGVLRKRRAPECDGLDQFAFTEDGKALVSASGSIYRKGCARPFSTTVFYKEYAATNRQGSITAMWRDKSHIMLSKCLEAQLTRLGFYDVCGELLIDEETQSRGQVEDPEPASTPPAPSPVGVKPETSEPVVETKQPEPEAPTPTFEERMAALISKIGGEPKEATAKIKAYFRAFLGVERLTAKDATFYSIPLSKLEAVIDARLADLKINPGGLGDELAGRAKGILETEFDRLNWPEDLREMAKRVMQALAHKTDQDFLTFMNVETSGVGLRTMPIDAIRAFLPLFLIAKGVAWDVVDQAISKNTPIADYIAKTIERSGKPLAEWDAEFAREYLSVAKGDGGDWVLAP